MAKIWNYKYGDNTICVKNTFDGCELQVNGQLQDKKSGISLRDELQGKLSGGEAIKATLGGTLKMECNLFVDNVLQTPVEVK